MGEVTILAYFHLEEDAKKAAQELKKRRFETVQLADFSPMPGENASDLDNPISEPMSALATEVLEAKISGRDAGILAASRTDASGMADGAHRDKMENWLVTVVAPAERHQEAKQVLKQHGARV